MPSTNRNRNGCISEVRMRSRSRLKRISSRFQTTLIARSSLRDAARRHAHARDLARSGLRALPAAAPSGAVGAATRRRAAPSAAHHPRHVAAHVGRCRRTSASRIVRAGVGHEHVVERRARDADRADRLAELGEQARHELLAVGHAERDRALGDLGLDRRSARAARRSPPRRRRSRSARGRCRRSPSAPRACRAR